MEFPWKTELEIPKDLWNFHTIFEWKIDATGEGGNPASRVGSLVARLGKSFETFARTTPAARTSLPRLGPQFPGKGIPSGTSCPENRHTSGTSSSRLSFNLTHPNSKRVLPTWRASGTAHAHKCTLCAQAEPLREGVHCSRVLTPPPPGQPPGPSASAASVAARGTPPASPRSARSPPR